jgi:DNA-binding transcriptional regulator YhcF (GntR family)
MLDRIDKAIIKLLLKYKEKYLSTNEIALKVKISPLTAKRHLQKIEEEGYVSFRTTGVVREYSRKRRKKKNG